MTAYSANVVPQVTATLTADGAVNVPGNPPQIITRALTVNFTQAASVGGQDATVDVVVTPLNNGATDAATTAIVGGPQSAVVDLTASPNPQVVFYLVPSNYPGLATPVNYRIAWRQGVLSRTYTTDFAMPDADINFAALANLGDVIDGTAYLQQSDLGVAGRVARLNAQGQVMDADGNAISMASIDAVTGLINTEIANRQAADQSLQTNFTNQLSAQQTTVESYAQTQASQAAGAVQALLTTETSNREAADTTLQNQINTNSGKIAANVTALAGKASLTGGVVPPSQLPARPTEHTVATVAALTGLTTALQGDLAVVTGTGTYMLVATDPTQAANWVLVSPVASVAGKTGAVTLTATDVGAVASVNGVTPTNGAVTLSPGSIGALSASAPAMPTAWQSTLNTQLAGYATLTAGVLTSSEIPPLTHSNLTDWAAATADFATLVDGKVPAGQLPTTGGGNTPSTATVSWVTASLVKGSAPDAKSIEATGDVTLGSPWGIDTTGTVTGTAGWYYVNGDGTPIAASDRAWPYLTPNGHLELRQWDETAPADSPPVTQATLATWWATQSATVATAASVSSLTTTVDANTAALTTKADLVGGVLKSSEIPPLTTANLTNWASATSGFVTLTGGKLPKSDLPTLDTTDLGDWTAVSAGLATLTGGVLTSSQIPQIAHTDISDWATATAGFATLTDGVLTAAQLPPIAASNVTGLAADLSAKADLTGPGGTLVASELPPLTTANLTNWAAATSNFATLVDGAVPLGQLPAGTITTGHSVTTQAAMLALAVVPGDIAVVTGDAAPSNDGIWLLNSSPASTLGNWLQLSGPAGNSIVQINTPDGAAASVTGTTVTLTPAAIGSVQHMTAAQVTAANGTIPAQAQVQWGQIEGYALTAAMMQSGVETLLDASPENYLPVQWFTPNSTLLGTPTVAPDGTAATNGDRMLVADSSQPAKSGIYVLSSGAWVRATDMPSTAFVVQGAKVIVLKGATYAHSLWQFNGPSGIVSAGLTFTNVGAVAPPFVPANGPGTSGTEGVSFQASTNTFSVQVPPNDAKGLTPGIQVATSGISVTPDVSRVFSAVVPAAVTMQDANGTPYYESTITHNLGTSNLIVQVQDVSGANPQLVMVGTTVSSTTIVLDFAESPGSGQYRVIACGQGSF